MFDLTNPLFVASLAGGLLLAWCVRTVLFQAGCALADVVSPGFLKSLLVVGLALVLCVPLGGFLSYLLGKLDGDPAVLLGPMRLLGVGLSLLGTWALSALL